MVASCPRGAISRSTRTMPSYSTVVAPVRTSVSERSPPWSRTVPGVASSTTVLPFHSMDFPPVWHRTAIGAARTLAVRVTTEVGRGEPSNRYTRPQGFTAVPSTSMGVQGRGTALLDPDPSSQPLGMQGILQSSLDVVLPTSGAMRRVDRDDHLPRREDSPFDLLMTSARLGIESHTGPEEDVRC